MEKVNLEHLEEKIQEIKGKIQEFEEERTFLKNYRPFVIEKIGKEQYKHKIVLIKDKIHYLKRKLILLEDIKEKEPSLVKSKIWQKIVADNEKLKNFIDETKDIEKKEKEEVV